MDSVLKEWSKIPVLVAALALAASPAFASINYGDFDGSTLMYLDVTESSATDPVPPALYGPPSISGDLLDFDPGPFAASSTGGPIDLTDGQLNFTVMADPGQAITTLIISEGGDYSFTGIGGAGTTASASLGIRVDILEVDGVTLATPLSVTATTTFEDDLASSGTGLFSWDLSAAVALNVAVANLNPRLGVTKAEVVIDNLLATNSEADTAAFIAKKDFKVDGETIPEPATAALLGLGGLALAARRKH